MSENMSNAGSRLGNEVEDVQNGAQQAGRKLADTASDYVSKAKDYAKQGYDAATQKTKEYKENAEGYISDNPWYAVGIALGVGVLVGMLLKSRD